MKKGQEKLRNVSINEIQAILWNSKKIGDAANTLGVSRKCLYNTVRNRGQVIVNKLTLDVIEEEKVSFL